jgi:SAM-dependent methyltransferase
LEYIYCTMIVKKHYDTHLARFYSWMTGDFETNVREQIRFFESQGITPSSTKTALDLGCGHGIQSAALAKMGFSVKAVDFSKQLLDELRENCKGLDVTPCEQDILTVGRFEELKPELIVCMGDTLTHLESEGRIETFLEQCADTLIPGGKLVLSFRDYSEKLSGDHRFIPVKNDGTRILTSFLDFLPTHVMVTDLLYEFEGNTWQQKISSYPKVRISPEEVLDFLGNNKLEVTYNETLKGMIVIIASKSS